MKPYISRLKLCNCVIYTVDIVSHQLSCRIFIKVYYSHCAAYSKICLNVLYLKVLCDCVNFFPLINKSEVYGNICRHFFTTTHRYNDRNTANTEQPVHPFSYLRTWPRGTWTPLLWPACHPFPKEAIFRAENHCLKFECTNPHPSHFTLCCKPPQCMLRVIRWGSKQNHMICWKQKCNLRATSQTHSWPRLGLEILAMKIHIGFEGAALGPTPTGISLNVRYVNTASTFSHTRTKWLVTMTPVPNFFQYPP